MASLETLTKLRPLPEITLGQDSKIAYVPSNRNFPNQCLWTCKNSLLADPNLTVVFPGVSICHLFIGATDTEHYFAHIAPTTTLFGKYANDLEILFDQFPKGSEHNNLNLYYFDKRWGGFRNIASQLAVSRGIGINYDLMDEGDYGKTLAFNKDGLFVVKDYKSDGSYKDVSNLGRYNVREVNVIE